MFKNKAHCSLKNTGPITAQAVKAILFAGLTSLVTLSASSSYAAPSLATYKTQISQVTQSLSADENQIKKIERVLWSLDKKILEQKKVVREERSNNRTAFHEAKRELKRQTFESQRIQTAIRLIEKDIQLTIRDSQRSTEYHNSLNAFRRQLESETHETKIAQNQQRTLQLTAEKNKLEEELTAINLESTAAAEKLKLLQEQGQETSVDLDPRLQSILAQRETQAALIISLRKQVKRNRGLLIKTNTLYQELANHIKLANSAPAPAAISPIGKKQKKQAAKPEFSSYVFAISGEYDANIEDTLQLKEWVESYTAKYIQASWNGFSGNNDSRSTDAFKKQFQKHLESIHADANIILIGHGRGGGAAIEAATEIATKLNRSIEFLAVIDPIGEGNLRANIVYNNAQAFCPTPKENDRIINTEYSDCIRDAQRREITSNIKHFYNRWQKDNEGPLDYQRRIGVVNNKGDSVEAPTATGRFSTSASIEADQKRVFIGEDKDAHRTLLAQASKTLPKLLVKHLR